MADAARTFSAHGARILVIDDSRSIRELVTSLLREAGFSVDEAADASSGLALIIRHEPDVILLDVEMPGISGLQTLDLLAREQHLFSVIMFTTHAETMVEAFAKGADDFIVKPFKQNELLARVAAAERSVYLKRQLADARRIATESLVRLRDTQAKLVEEKKLQAIGRLAAGLAHEFNNPLGFVRSNLSTLSHYADFLLTSLQTALSASRQEPATAASPPSDTHPGSGIDGRLLKNIKTDLHPLLDETREGIDRIAEIVRCFQCLDLGISGTNQVREEDLNSVVSGALSAVSENISTEVELVVKLAEGRLPVLGTISMLNMAFANLISNAIEAVGENGRITIATGSDATSMFCDIGQSGSGIAETVLPSLFDPFVTTKIGHLGLGLTVASCFINAHGGSISVTSNDRDGACFRIRLPAAAVLS